MRELQEFCKIAEQAGGLRVDDDKARIFKVLPMPISPDEHPPELKEFTGYEFYAIDIVTNKAQEFVPELGEEAYSKFLAKAMDLAHDISEVIKRLKQKIEAGQKAAAAPVIYLAETSSDQAAARDAIKRELRERGCVIVPSRPLLAAPDFEQAVGEDLAHAKLAVHIIGKKYGWIPENAECSMVHLQTEIASRRGSDPGFKLSLQKSGRKSADRPIRSFRDFDTGERTFTRSMEYTDTVFNPFPGLRPFEFDENHLFFGRDGQTDELLRRLRRQRFLAVVGTSGSGKSSLVRAGLLPDVYGGFMVEAGSSWRVALLKPGSDPIGNLAFALSQPEALGPLAEDAVGRHILEMTLRRSALGLGEVVREARMEGNVLIIVDQFEEVFRFKRAWTAEHPEDEAASFVKLLP